MSSKVDRCVELTKNYKDFKEIRSISSRCSHPVEFFPTSHFTCNCIIYKSLKINVNVIAYPCMSIRVR